MIINLINLKNDFFTDADCFGEHHKFNCAHPDVYTFLLNYWFFEKLSQLSLYQDFSRIPCGKLLKSQTYVATLGLY